MKSLRAYKPVRNSREPLCDIGDDDDNDTYNKDNG